MSVPDRRAMLDRSDRSVSIRRQCQLLGLARSGVYRTPVAANDNDLALMRRLDELFTARPFLGSRRMARMPHGDSTAANRKRVQRLMRRMGIAALGPKPRTSIRGRWPSPARTLLPSWRTSSSPKRARPDRKPRCRSLAHVFSPYRGLRPWRNRHRAGRRSHDFCPSYRRHHRENRLGGIIDSITGNFFGETHADIGRPCHSACAKIDREETPKCPPKPPPKSSTPSRACARTSRACAGKSRTGASTLRAGTVKGREGERTRRQVGAR